jgi:hypothetical protein
MGPVFHPTTFIVKKNFLVGSGCGAGGVKDVGLVA